MTPTDLLSFFPSKTWRLQRSITDRSNGMIHSYSAEAEFQKDENGLVYEELGELQYNHHVYQMRRRYLYRQNRETIEVCFEDGRPFYTIDCSQLPATSFKHQCDSDLYSGELSLAPDRWQIHWKVEGPKKQLFIYSSYS